MQSRISNHNNDGFLSIDRVKSLLGQRQAELQQIQQIIIQRESELVQLKTKSVQLVGAIQELQMLYDNRNGTSETEELVSINAKDSG